MTGQEILKALKPLVKDGKLECRDALELAKKLEIESRQIGKVCNQNEIRIINCQLGCFGTVSKNKPV